jgi:hypothetical protein
VLSSHAAEYLGDYIPGMSAFLLTVLWTIPFLVFQWLGLAWYWAMLGTLPVMAAGYLLYYRWVDHHG